MLGKSQNFIELLPSAQSSLRNSTSKNQLKNRNWTFPVLHSFTWKLEFVSNILWMTVEPTPHYGKLDRIFQNKSFKDTHRENTLSNKTKMITKSMNMYIWTIGTLNQLFIRGSYTQIKFFKKWSSRWPNSVLFDRSVLYSPLNLS